MCLSQSFKTVPRVLGSVLGATCQEWEEKVMVVQIGKGQDGTGSDGPVMERWEVFRAEKRKPASHPRGA